MTEEHTVGRAALEGVRRCLALAVGVLPFGFAVGAMASEQGMSAGYSALMSVVIFAGASQLAMLELARSGAPVLALVAVAVVINLRLALYGGTLAPHLQEHTRPRRLLLAYLLTDQLFALSIDRATAAGGRRHLAAFYVGGGLTIWLAWQLGTIIGAVLGVQAPPELALDFIAPLVFVALAVSALRTRTDMAVGATAAVTCVLLGGLPMGLDLIVAIGIGVGVGVWRSGRGE